jgi:hypothetical protein
MASFLRVKLAREVKKSHQDVIIVQNISEVPNLYSDQILPLVHGRAVMLDYAKRQDWNSHDFAVKVYRHFGSHSKVSFHDPQYLPAVIILKGYSKPRVFSFGSLSTNRETRLEDLRKELAG